MKDDIPLNMLRDRAKKSDDITDKMWENVPDATRFYYNEYFKLASSLSPDTLIQYRSALKIFFYYIYEHCNNKEIWRIKKTDFIKYINWLEEKGLSSSAMKVKRYAVSSFCNKMEIVSEEIEEDDKYPEMAKFRHFARVKMEIAKNSTYDKIPVTREEFDMVMNKLKKNEDYLAIAYWGIGYNVGFRRSEAIQFLSEIADYEKKEGQDYILSHNIRLKGKGKTGKVEKYLINDEAMMYIKLILENRDFESKYIFSNKNGKKLSRDWVNSLFSNTISPLLGRRITSHGMKNSCITYMLEQGYDIKLVSKYIAHHESTEVTSKFYDLRNNDDELNGMFS